MEDLRESAPMLNSPEFNQIVGNQLSGSTSSCAQVSSIQHYEMFLDDLPGFSKIARSFEGMCVKPTSVDLHKFNSAYSKEDLDFSEMSPTDPQFFDEHSRTHAVGLEKDHSPQFHLVNLDEHVDWAGYDDYFSAKIDVLRWVKGIFGHDVRFSGSLWYPPSSYRLWHTNEEQPGWRMYLIDFDEVRDGNEIAGQAFFRYMNPYTKEIVTLPEKPRIARFFKVEQDPARLFWHCIVNRSNANRWSFGFAVPDSWSNCIEVDAIRKSDAEQV
jgi:hypothetical protein